MPESAVTPPSPLRAATPDTPPSSTGFGNGAEPTSLAEELQQLRAQLAEAQARADNLEIALHTRRVIGAAAGIVMSQYRLTIDAAVDVLRAISQHTNRKVRDIAEDVLCTGVLELGPSTPSAHTPINPNGRTFASSPSRFFVDTPACGSGSCFHHVATAASASAATSPPTNPLRRRSSCSASSPQGDRFRMRGVMASDVLPASESRYQIDTDVGAGR